MTPKEKMIKNLTDALAFCEKVTDEDFEDSCWYDETGLYDSNANPKTYKMNDCYSTVNSG